MFFSMLVDLSRTMSRKSRGGGTGRRDGLKIRWASALAGSNPALGTTPGPLLLVTLALEYLLQVWDVNSAEFMVLLGCG
jgi:hypothetical protein